MSGPTRRTDAAKPTRHRTAASTPDRRRFLIVAGGAVAYAALRPHIAWARRAGRDWAPLQSWRLPDEAPGSLIETARALIGAAVLAPSHWNTQPWRFEVEGASVRLVADPQRALPVNDPDQRAMMLSLGAALENLLVAARAWGLRPNVTYFPFDGARGVVADVSWTTGEARRDRGLFTVIPERRTNRRSYDGRGIFMQNRAQLIAQIPEEMNLHWLDDRDDIRAVADLARDATREEISDARRGAERYAWTRFENQAERRGDGVPVESLEIGGPAAWFASRTLNPESHFFRWGAEAASKQTREVIRSAGAVVLLTAKKRAPASPDAGAAPPPRRENAWLIGGQAYERLALKATQLGIAQQPVHEPIEVERYRGELLRLFGARGEDPLMLVRLGHAHQPPHTPRRSVALVASFRNS